jgi:phosphoribosylanthranilate isomerase
MSAWIKICGLTTKDAVRAAIEAGATAIGFVFAPSKRQVTATRAAELTAEIPAGALRVAVMQHPSQSAVDEVFSIFKPDVLQTDHEDLVGLRVPTSVQVVPVVRAGKLAPEPLPRRMLFEGPMSGTGQTADWTHAAALARKTELILAGGLTPDNVADAIVRVQPFGVDVSSGVERSPGIKDVNKIAEFVRRAREAFSRNIG